MLALLLIGALSIRVQGGKSGAGYDLIEIATDGAVRLERTDSYDAKPTSRSARLSRQEAKRLFALTEGFDKLKDSYENDRQASHWNTTVVTYNDKRVVVEGGSPEPKLVFTLVEAVSRAIKTIVKDPFLRWL